MTRDRVYVANTTERGVLESADEPHGRGGSWIANVVLEHVGRVGLAVPSSVGIDPDRFVGHAVDVNALIYRRESDDGVTGGVLIDIRHHTPRMSPEDVIRWLRGEFDH